MAGVKNEYLRNRLLRELDLNLNKAELICRAAEPLEWQLKALNEEKNVQAVNSKPCEKSSTHMTTCQASCKGKYTHKSRQM